MWKCKTTLCKLSAKTLKFKVDKYFKEASGKKRKFRFDSELARIWNIIILRSLPPLFFLHTVKKLVRTFDNEQKVAFKINLDFVMQ